LISKVYRRFPLLFGFSFFSPLSLPLPLLFPPFFDHLLFLSFFSLLLPLSQPQSDSPWEAVREAVSLLLSDRVWLSACCLIRSQTSVADVCVLESEVTVIRTSVELTRCTLWMADSDTPHDFAIEVRISLSSIWEDWEEDWADVCEEEVPEPEAEELLEEEEEEEELLLLDEEDEELDEEEEELEEEPPDDVIDEDCWLEDIWPEDIWEEDI